ncbi:MAG: hypothetical protein CVV18_08830, partial [Gammaproteobacteria bacterium HGW-Gammaproteobacteria-8]
MIAVNSAFDLGQSSANHLSLAFTQRFPLTRFQENTEMTSRFAPRLLVAAVLATALATPALAQQAGDWLFRIGGGYIATDTSNDELVFEGITLNDFRADVDDG